MNPQIILASGSPRRKMLLEWAEVSFTVKTADTEEIIQPGLLPEEVAIDIAREKATAVRKTLEKNQSESIIIAADTIVVLENEIIGKPKDRNHAIETLNKLSGKQHRVITGVVMINDIHHESVDNVASKTPNNMRRAEVKRCIVFLVYPSEEVQYEEDMKECILEIPLHGSGI